MKSTKSAWALIASLSATQAFAAPQGLIDPTRPADNTRHSETASHPPLSVQAVITRQGTSIAVVNGHIVRAGDRLANVAIAAVTPTGVLYLQAGHREFAPLLKTKLDLRDLRVQNKVP